MIIKEDIQLVEERSFDSLKGLDMVIRLFESVFLPAIDMFGWFFITCQRVIIADGKQSISVLIRKHSKLAV